MDAENGGLQLPQIVQTAAFAWFQAANIATWGYTFLTVTNANLLLAHGRPEQVATYVSPMMEGRFHGTMCLSEPQAGSSLSDITTRAEPQPDGSHWLLGNKMWISAGDHELGENRVAPDGSCACSRVAVRRQRSEIGATREPPVLSTRRQ